LQSVIPSGQQATDRRATPVGMIVYNFMRDTPATTFYPGGPQRPPGMTIPKAGNN
jgi:histidine ammonia-lyase